MPKKKKKESLAYNVYRKARNPDRFLHSISKSSILALYLHTNNYSNVFWVDIKVCFFLSTCKISFRDILDYLKVM